MTRTIILAALVLGACKPQPRRQTCVRYTEWMFEYTGQVLRVDATTYHPEISCLENGFMTVYGEFPVRPKGTMFVYRTPQNERNDVVCESSSIALKLVDRKDGHYGDCEKGTR